MDPVFDRPVFIVSPPRSGSTMLFEAVARSPDVYTIGGESHGLIETIPALHPAARDFASNCLGAEDVAPSVSAELRRRFRENVRDRSGNRPGAGSFRMLEKTPKNSLRIPFLARVFPEAYFLVLHREPRDVLASMMDAWLSGRFVTYPALGGWSLLLVPGWRALAGRPLHEVVAAQWQATVQVLLDDIAELPRERFGVVRYEDVVANPARVLPELCRTLGLGWDQPVANALPLARHTLTAPSPDKWRRHAAAIEAVLGPLAPVAERFEAAVAAAGR